MTEQNLEDNASMESNKKKPTLLVFLVVLSFIYQAYYLFDVIRAFITGPISEEQMEMQRAAFYESMSQMQSQGMDGFIDFFEKLLRFIEYANFEAFYLLNITSLVSVLLGITAVILMIKLKKIGFHLYVAYSLLPVILMYLIFPMEIISTFIVVSQIVIAAIFCVLYGLNLKHMD
tara:strand:- start:20 stop:544 length:525 start_codon:yes stop_codon:yes gene_type:complete